MPDYVKELFDIQDSSEAADTASNTAETPATEEKPEDVETSGVAEEGTEGPKDSQEQPSASDEKTETGKLEVQPEQKPESEVKLYANKYKTVGHLVKGVESLSQKLGIPVHVEDMTVKDMEKWYLENEPKLNYKMFPGTQTPVQQTETNSIQQQLAQQMELTNKLLNHLNQQAQPPVQPEKPLYDKDELTAEFMEDPIGVIEKLFDIKAEIAGKQLGEGLKQQLTPFVKYVNEQTEREKYMQVVQNVASQHDDFKDYLSDIEMICELNPTISKTIREHPELGGQCLEVAYQLAKVNKLQRDYETKLQAEAKVVAEQSNAQIQAEKQVGRLPNSPSKGTTKPLEDDFVKNLFDL